MALIMRKDALCNNPMTWDWMTIVPTPEESFETEKIVRSVMTTQNVNELQGLCVSLVRQNRHTATLLRQAVNRIAEIDGQDL